MENRIDQSSPKKLISKEGTCRLCGMTTKLIKAHIIPKTLFKDVFSDGKIVYYDMVDPSKSFSQSDTGYDKAMFCKNCDGQLIGKFDNYFAEKIFGSKGDAGKKGVEEVLLAQKDGIKINKLQGLDYDLLKLFCLSILLRASLTDNKFFKDVDVEKFHDELFSMIKAGVACEENRFRVCMIKIIKDGSRPYSCVIKPGRNRYKRNSYYLFYINGVAILINISKTDMTPIFEQGYLKSDGTMSITYLSQKRAQDFFDRITGNQLPLKGNYEI